MADYQRLWRQTSKCYFEAENRFNTEMISELYTRAFTENWSWRARRTVPQGGSIVEVTGRHVTLISCSFFRLRKQQNTPGAASSHCLCLQIFYYCLRRQKLSDYKVFRLHYILRSPCCICHVAPIILGMPLKSQHRRYFSWSCRTLDQVRDCPIHRSGYLFTGLNARVVVGTTGWLLQTILPRSICWWMFVLYGFCGIQPGLYRHPGISASLKCGTQGIRPSNAGFRWPDFLMDGTSLVIAILWFSAFTIVVQPDSHYLDHLNAMI
jgi:hypothetical protein